MEIKFYSQKEYRIFLRKLSEGARFETRSKPFEMPIILFIDSDKIKFYG